jgi:hypothetical protein
MEELDLARCKRISDEAVFHIMSLRGLKKLGLAETGVGAKGMSLLPVLSSLTYLDLGGCPVTDEHLIAFQVSFCPICVYKPLILLNLSLLAYGIPFSNFHLEGITPFIRSFLGCILYSKTSTLCRNGHTVQQIVLQRSMICLICFQWKLC